MTYQDCIIEHYQKVWKNEGEMYLWDKGPFEKMPFDFRVLEFPPSNSRDMWTYATCCMSQLEDLNPIELHLFSCKKDEKIIELLTATAYYHRNTEKLKLWNTVNFGKSWQDQSICNYGIISLPYLDGPDIENLKSNGTNIVNFYWLIPVTKSEVEFKKKHGIEELEKQFEKEGLDYINPERMSIV